MDKSRSRKVSILFRAGEVAIKRNSIKNQKQFLLGSRLWTGKVEWGEDYFHFKYVQILF